VQVRLRHFAAALLLVGCGPTSDPLPAHHHAPLSAARDPADSFYEAVRKTAPQFLGKEDGDSPVVANRRLPLAHADRAALVGWDPAELADGFALARDTRAIPSATHPDFPRRPAFLYPDDGCFVRAEYMANELAHAGHPRPAKVFVFGNLSVATANAPSGRVSWWYHVAPVVVAGDQTWVLDPSIEPTAAITLEDWIGRQTPVDQAQVSFCSPFAYTPDDRCDAPAPADLDGAAMRSQDFYLDAEWQRQLDLHRDPTQVLQDMPPWVTTCPGYRCSDYGFGEGDCYQDWKCDDGCLHPSSC
jgi:hypothetical protein